MCLGVDLSRVFSEPVELMSEVAAFASKSELTNE
jgi:hypothetical protein